MRIRNRRSINGVVVVVVVVVVVGVVVSDGVFQPSSSLPSKFTFDDDYDDVDVDVDEGGVIRTRIKFSGH